MVTTPLNFSQRDYLDAISELAPAGQLESFNLICEESSNIIVNLVDSYNASGETLAHAAVFSNQDSGPVLKQQLVHFSSR